MKSILRLLALAVYFGGRAISFAWLLIGWRTPRDAEEEDSQFFLRLLALILAVAAVLLTAIWQSAR